MSAYRTDYTRFQVLTPVEHVKSRWEKFINFNDIRQQELMEMAQYSFLYFAIGLPIASFTDWLFPNYDENISSLRLFVEVTIQLIVDVLLLFYLKKLIKIVPFLFRYEETTYVPSLASAFNGDIVISLAYLSVQQDLQKKLKLLSGRFIVSFLGCTESTKDVVLPSKINTTEETQE